jgi:hypothetical protein
MNMMGTVCVARCAALIAASPFASLAHHWLIADFTDETGKWLSEKARREFGRDFPNDQ